MPIGVPTRLAMPTRIRLPAIALSKPPSLPGGGVIFVKRSSVSPPKPSLTTSNRIQASQKRPNAIAASESASATRFTSLRRACSVMSGPRAFVAREAVQQQLGGGEHEERDEEEDESQLHQRCRVQSRVRFL